MAVYLDITGITAQWILLLLLVLPIAIIGRLFIPFEESRLQNVFSSAF